MTEDIREEMARGQDQGISTAELAGKGAAGNRDEGTASLIDPSSQTTEEQVSPLFAKEAAEDLHRRWDAIQAGFVDEPRSAVKQADSLVAGTMKRLAEMFADERSRLEGQWDRGDDVTTEDLRLALRRYRSFFDRLLSM